MKKLLKRALEKLDWMVYYKAYKNIRNERSLKSTYFDTDWEEFQRAKTASEERFAQVSLTPLVLDRTEETPFEPHYTYHPAWAARVLAQTKPEKHIDISSTLKFCTVISAFIPVDFYDYRPARLNLSNLESKAGNLLALPFADNSIHSLSCMHTIEHIGLGRYGDAVDYDGDLKAIRELKRVLAFDGNLLIVTPIGKSRIEFNAHRVYSYSQILDYFSDLKLQEFSLVPDNYLETGLITNASQELADQQSWGCGCFWFKKVKGQ